MDRKTQEVEIEARVVAATRSFARDIGTQLGFGWGNGTTAVGGAGAAGSSPLTASGLTPNYIQSTTPLGSIPLFSNLGATAPTSGLSFINATNNIRIDAVLTMAESRGLLKVLSVRACHAEQCSGGGETGYEIPIMTASTIALRPRLPMSMPSCG